jgi:hypothetical protein
VTRPICTTFGLAAVLLGVLSCAADAGPEADAAPGCAPVELQMTDGSVLKVALRDQRLTLKTPYGSLSIPSQEVVRIEFATRVPAEVARRLGELGSTDYRARETAQSALARMGVRAFAGLTGATGHKDPEVARRAKDLLEKLRDDLPEEPPEPRPHDVIHTCDARFVGRIEGELVQVASETLGELRLRLEDVREIRVAGDGGPPVDPATALPDPGSLSGFQQQVGKRFVFKVAGTTGGPLWGTDFYTTDSRLATAAVHAGVLRVGQVGLVRVKVVPPRATFSGSTRHGVTSDAYGSYPAFQILR